jgi:hypothetical protein
MTEAQSNAKIKAANDAFDRLLVKPNRAKKHIRDLNDACDAFDKSHPYVVSTDINPQTREYTYKIESIQSVPLEIAAIAGDALQNLRSALDHLAYRLVEVAGGEPTSRTGFPIFESAEKYAHPENTGKVKGMGNGAIEAINNLKPYGGGNDALWHLHQLNNRDKHRLLIAVAAKNLDYNMTPSQREDACRNFLGIDPSSINPKPSDFLTQPPVIMPLEPGYVLRSIPESEVDKSMHFLIDVAFSEPEIATPEPVVETLNRMANVVIGIICDFSTQGLLDS